MFRIFLSFSILLFLLSPSTKGVKSPNTKAASPYTNCGCQCSNLTFRDKYGKTHGNCKSSDHTGAVWCYVDPNQSSSCQDLSYTSVRFPGKPWSYEACATPACGLNGGGFNNGYNGGYGSGSSGSFGSSNCRGSKCLSGPSSNGFNSGSGYNGGNNNEGFNTGYNGGSNSGSGYNGGNNNGGFSTGYNGGSNSGSLYNGGSNSGSGYNGGNNNGGFSTGYNGGSNSGSGYNGGNNNNGFGNTGLNNGFNSGSGYSSGSSGFPGSTNCKGERCFSGSGTNGFGLENTNGYGSLESILSGRSQSGKAAKDSIKFG